MHNPYLMGSGLLKCFDDGITNNIDPGKPESRSMYEAQAAGKKVKKLPLSLGEALDRLENDEVIKSAMPDEMYKVFKWYKNDEWEKIFRSNNSVGSRYLSRLFTIIFNNTGEKICAELQA